jgi:hypothetical protein
MSGVRLPDRYEYTKTPATVCYASQKKSQPNNRETANTFVKATRH